MITIRNKSGYRLIALFVLATLAIAGCRVPSSNLPDDGPSIVTSDEASRHFVDKIAAASEAAAQSGELSVTVTQEEASSFLQVAADLAAEMQLTEAQNLRDLDLEQVRQAEGLPQWLRDMADEEALPDVRLPGIELNISIEDPVVYFRDGQLILRGTAEALEQRQPLRLVFRPTVLNGELMLDYVEGQFGPLPVPELLIAQAREEIESLLLDSREYVEITGVEVAEGTLTLTGRYLR
ncbi:MAG TPA: hypothetical protein VLC95_15770 [Anaerolineae bacterium]|nr:hypothetical protein [Anaerolineae bacterium]